MIAMIRSAITARRSLQCSAILRWSSRGFWAATDQALFAGTNFLVNIFLARWLEPTAYGAFSTAYAVFLLLGTAHTSLWTEPMLVFGSGRYRVDFAGYLTVLIQWHWLFGALAALLFALTGWILHALGQPALGLAFLGLSVAAPLSLYLWLVRRSAYVLFEPQLAAGGGVLYLTVFLALLWALQRMALLNEASVLFAMGAAALFGGIWIKRLICARLSTGQAVASIEVARRHWTYGRWALLAGALSWVPGNIYLVLLSTFDGFETAAEYRAHLNLIMPILHFNGALGGLLVPAFVGARARGCSATYVRTALTTLGTLALGYWLFLAIGGHSVALWLYGGRYETPYLFWLGVVPVLAVLTNVYGSVLRAVERPDLVVRACFAAAAASLSLGLALSWSAGLAGAVAGLILANLVLASSMIRNGWRVRKSQARRSCRVR